MKVFFSDKMSAKSNSFSPSSEKPALAVQSWLDLGMGIEVVDPEPVSVEQLCRAHDPQYVIDVLACRIHNGFGNRSKALAKTFRYTCGAMLDAAREAVRSGGCACAPVSGFHHAGYSNGGGFCTFNGLMVAALDLLESGEVSRVGILDCDQHYGNGTDNILRRVNGSHRINHFTVGKRHSWDGRSFLAYLPHLVRHEFGDCDVLLYQAGADPHVDDPLGGWLTTEQLRERDEIVFSVARDLGLSVAWNLAGGYQRDENGGISPVLEIHNNTMSACLSECRNINV